MAEPAIDAGRGVHRAPVTFGGPYGPVPIPKKPTVVEGIQTEQFLVRNGAGQQPVQFLYWIGPDGLPLQLRHQGVSQGQPYTMTVRYSRFNDPAIVIDTPIASE